MQQSLLFTPALGTAFLLSAGACLAQPTITAVLPAANATTAPAAGPVRVTFSQPLTGASAAGLKIYSGQRGGYRTTAEPAVVSGNTLTFTPAAYPFAPGEKITATITQAAASSGGALAEARTTEFRVATGGTGQGNFESRIGPSVYEFPDRVRLGDLDGDGDLDVVTKNLNQISIRLNTGNGTFRAPATNADITTGLNPSSIELGDVDGDGDLDLVSTHRRLNAIEVWRNPGNGLFGNPPTLIATASLPVNVTLGDIDGDGDLDLLFDSSSSGPAWLENSGAGIFTRPATNANLGLVNHGGGFILGDVNGDGRLDFVSPFVNSVGVYLNGGGGRFTASSAIMVGSQLGDATLGDFDADGDLDLVVLDRSSMHVRFNNGQGSFSGSTTFAMATDPYCVAVGDIDADGDLDIIASYIGTHAVSANYIRLNDGRGNFARSYNFSATYPFHFAVGDIDNDQDLDIVVASFGNGMTTCFNQPHPVTTGVSRPVSATLALYPNPARTTVHISGAPAKAPVALLDALSRTVPMATTTTDAEGQAQLTLPAGLAPGIYLVRSGSQVRQLAVE